MRAIDVRLQIVQPQAVDGRIDGVVVEMRGVELRHLAPRRHARRRDVLPILAAVAGQVDQPIVGAGPDHVHVEARRAD